MQHELIHLWNILLIVPEEKKDGIINYDNNNPSDTNAKIFNEDALIIHECFSKRSSITITLRN